MLSRTHFFPIVLLATVLISCGGSGDKLNDDSKTDTASTAAVQDPFPNLKVDVNPTTIAKGGEIYQRTCSPCHGTTGKGDGPAAVALNPKPQNHTNGAYMDKLTDGHIFAVIRQGGAPFGKPGMPANPQISEEEAKYLVAYVRSLSNTFKKQ